MLSHSTGLLRRISVGLPRAHGRTTDAPARQHRKKFPGVYKAHVEFDRTTAAAVEAAGLSNVIGELVKVRVSQINGCGHCLRMHSRDAIAAGETTDCLAVLSVWWESQYFTEQEQAALSIAERVTRIGDVHTSPAREIDVEAALSEQQMAAVTWIAITINGWNRIAIASHYPVTPWAGCNPAAVTPRHSSQG